jgi:hypothetical protein
MELVAVCVDRDLDMLSLFHASTLASKEKSMVSAWLGEKASIHDTCSAWVTPSKPERSLVNAVIM